jgi:hypothetical protein
MRWSWLSTFALSCLLAACGGDSATDVASGGSGGIGAASGSSGQGGTSGDGGTSGSGGSVGGAGGSGGLHAGGAGGGLGGEAGGVSGGSAGSPSGGSAGSPSGGSGGTATAQPECTSAADCKVFEDCCRCDGVPKSEEPASCKLACTVGKCTELGVSPTSVDCVAGRCVKGYDCDTTKLTCRVAEPACQPGEVPQMLDQCYTGACVPASQCSFVPECGKCAAGDACASYVTQLGPLRHCVSIPAACGGAASCSCLGPTTCLQPFGMCSEFSGILGVSCECPVC